MNKEISTNNTRNFFHSKLLLIFMFLALIKPGCFSEFSTLTWIGNILNYFRVIIFGICLITFFASKMRLDKTIVFPILYYFIIIFVTIINNGPYFNLVYELLTLMSWIILFKYHMKYNVENFMDSLEFVFFTFITINFITVILFPGGFYINSSGYSNNYFLGYDNNFITYILPGLAVTIANSFRKKQKIDTKSIVLLIISLLTIYKVWSATSVFIITLLVIMMILCKNNKILKKIKLNKMIIFSIIIFFAIVIFRLQNVFSFLIEDILKKDLTFTGRTQIWNCYIELIIERPFLGYGFMDFKENIALTGAGHAHNLILNILFQGGITALLFFSLFLIHAVNKLCKNSNKGAKLLSIIIFVYMIAYIFEVYSAATLTLFCVILLLGIYSDKIFEREKVEK